MRQERSPQSGNKGADLGSACSAATVPAFATPVYEAEQFNLQTARMGAIAEANGRSALYLGTLSSAVIAIAFVGQANQLGDAFYLFVLTLLPPVFLLGVFTYLRLDPAAVPFFPPTDPQGIKKLERIGVVTTSPLQTLLTAASMVACINAIVGG